MAKRKAEQALRPKNGSSMGDSEAQEVKKPVQSLADLSSDSNVDSSAESELSEAEEEEVDDDDLEEEEEEPKQGTVKRKINQVSAAEVRAAREASETFRSNVFKLQVDELLKEISVEEKYALQARKLLFSVREAIANTTEVGPLPYSKIQRALNTRIPFPSEIDEPEDPHEIKYKFGFVPPALDEINVVGSWSLHTTVRRPARCVGVDLYVPMADSLFDSKDNLDFRYHRKRAFFLAVLASQLAEKSTDLHIEPRFERFNGHSLRPVLQLVPTGPLVKLGKRVCIYIHVGPESPELFGFSRLQRHRNSNRAVEGPTPIYNWSVLSDLCIMPLLRYLHATAAISPAFVDAAKLGALWLQQRSWASDPTKGGFGAFEFAIVMATLLNGGSAHGKKRLLPGFSSYQLLKGTLLYIAEVPEIRLDASLFDRNEPTHISSERGLYFSDCGLDVLANMAPWAHKLLHHDAQIAVDLLSDGTRDRFEQLFLRDSGSKPYLRFDTHFEIKMPEEESPTDAINTLSKLLDSAWGARYVAMRVTPVTSVSQGSLQASWSLASDTPDYSVRKYSVGAILDANEAGKRVTFVGPEVNNSPEIFKRLWGSKASLRRFQDGEIRDATVWPQSAKPVVMEAAEYILNYHLGASVMAEKPLERLLSSAAASAEQTTAGFTAMATSFQKLGQTLHELRGVLPLRILSVYGTSANLRSASLDLPLPFVPETAGEGVIEMETSSKWPRDLEAAEKVKAAFLIKLAESMRKTHPQYYVVIGLEPAHANPAVEAAFATIQSPEGFYFKLRITSRSIPNQYLSDLVDHTRLITTMVYRYSVSLSTTMRLVKLWLEKQLLMTHITEPAAELLALSVFVNSAPWAPPVSGSTGFWRVLDLLSRWNWHENSLMLDVDRKLGEEEEEVSTNGSQIVTGCDMDLSLFQSMAAAFVKQRKQDPALTQAPWLISTKLDIVGSKWTAWEPRSRVAALIAARVTALAKVANPGVNVFKPELSDFDISWTVRGPPRATSKHKNIAVSDPQNAILSAHNVSLDLIRALTQIYRDSLVLFYSGSLGEDADAGHTLCGIWNRTALDPIPKLKANISFPVRPTKHGFELDKESLLQEIERLGTGMLSRN